MAARIDNGRVQLLTRTGLDWTGKYPSAAAALANLNVKTAYIDGELCGVDDGGLPSFAQTQAATDGERNVHLVYYAFLSPASFVRVVLQSVGQGQQEAAEGRTAEENASQRQHIACALLDKYPTCTSNLTELRSDGRHASAPGLAVDGEP
jgi:hypothetical protein